MKFLFSHHQLFIPEQFGRVVFEVENMKLNETVSGVPQKEFEPKINTLDTKVDQTLLSKSVEQQKFKEAEIEANRIVEEIRDGILRELPESQARNLTPKEYTQKVDDIGKRFAARYNHWNDEYLKILPNGWMDNMKIGGVVGVIAYGNTKGGFLDRTKNGIKWGALAAALAHPTLVGGVAMIAKNVGKEVLAPGIGVAIPNLVIGLIDNPSEIVDAALHSDPRKQQSVGDTPIYKLLTTGRTASQDFGKEIATGTQNVFELRAKGMSIDDPNLNSVMNEIDLYEQYKKNGQPRNFPESGIKNAATFILQMAAHKLNDEELAKFRVKIWNEEATPADIRRVLATNAQREVLQFFTDNNLSSQLNAELAKQKLDAVQNNTPIAQADLQKMFIDGTAAKGTDGFSFESPKRGIRRFLSLGAGGSALALYLISFLTISGLMKVQDLAQPDFYKKTVPEKAKKAFTFSIAPLTALGTWAKKKKAKNMLSEYRKAEPEPFTKKEQSAIWEKMSTDDKNTLITQTKDFVDKEKKENDKKFTYDELPPILKSKLEEVRKENEGKDKT